MKKKYRVEKNFKIVKRSCSLNRYYRVEGQGMSEQRYGISRTISKHSGMFINKKLLYVSLLKC
jgi:hypothetical protein